MIEIQGTIQAGIAAKQLKSILLTQGLSGSEIDERIIKDEYTFEDVHLMLYQDLYISELYNINRVPDDADIKGVVDPSVFNFLKGKGII